MNEIKEAMDALERLRSNSSDTVKIVVAHIQAKLINLQELINKEREG